MPKLKIHTFEIALEASFPSPVAFFDARTNEFAAKMSQIFPISPDQFRMRQFDVLYGYELKATFFGTNARLERTSSGIKLSLGGASTEHKDAITDLVSTFCEAILPEITPELTFVLCAHAGFESPEEHAAFFRPFGRCPEIVSEGIIAEVKLPNWALPVGVRFENSEAFENSVFAVHSSEIMLPLEPTSLGKMWASVEEAAKLFGLELPVLMNTSLIPSKKSVLLNQFKRSSNYGTEPQNPYRRVNVPQTTSHVGNSLELKAIAAVAGQFLQFAHTQRNLSGATTKPFHPRLQAALDGAYRLTELQDDWDDAGGTAYSKQHVDKVVNFLTNIAKSVPSDKGSYFPVPRINPGPGDSIDVQWKESGKNLLLNIPADSEQLSTFYGETSGGEKAEIRGILDIRYLNSWIADWLLPSMPCTK